MIPTITDAFFFSLFIQIKFVLPAHTVRTHASRARAHTQALLFVYAAIFSNRTGEGYTAGGKHRDLR